MILGTGIDMERIERVQEVYQLHGERFLRKILTEREREQFFLLGGDVRRMEYLSGRFSAKEAIAKACGCGIGQLLGWLDMEIAADPQGRPLVFLQREAVFRLGLDESSYQLHLSLSHASGWVVAQAILELM